MGTICMTEEYEVNSPEEAYRKILENYPKQPLELKRNPFNELHPKDQQLLREQYEKIFGN